MILPDETLCALPAWMMDPVVCSTITKQMNPCVSLKALRNLRALLDASPLSNPFGLDTVGSSSKTGDRNAKTSELPRNALGGSKPNME